MKLRTLVLTAAAFSSAAALASAPVAAGRPLSLAETVARMESQYPGQVVAIQYDGSGDKHPHFHVDMRFPHSGLARLDVDAVTLAISSRDPAPLRGGAATLADATLLVSAHVPGDVIGAELDAFAGVAPHYDVDVRLPQGAIARLKVDSTTRVIDWRSPAIVVD